jgi:catechol 2,3-dioxygenase-like lactoylglutathione lyase family enzyme
VLDRNRGRAYGDDMADITLLQVAQHADDLGRAEAFYHDVLGLPILAHFDPPGLVFVELGGIRILLETGATPTTLYLEVNDIDAEYRRLEAAGVRFEHGPQLIHRHDGTFAAEGLEEWMAFFRDSESNLMAIAERRAPHGASAGETLPAS